MAAETLTAVRARPGFPVAEPPLAGVLCCATGTYRITGAVEAGDIYKMCKVPAGAVVVDGVVYGDDIDIASGETFDMDVGWAANGVEAADSDGFGNMGILTGDKVAGEKPEFGIRVPLLGKLLTDGPQLFSAETTIQIQVIAPALVGGTGILTMVVYYIVDAQFAIE